MTNTNHDHDPDNDNGKHALEERVPAAATPAGGALASLAALAATLNKVDTASVLGHSGMPMLQFKRDGDGTWTFGKKRTAVEAWQQLGHQPAHF